MGIIHTTACVLCAQNCGLTVEVEKNRIVKVRGDKANAKSRGYVCRKGLSIASFQHHADRLTHPLKRSAGGFVRVSWDQALDEIAARLRDVVDAHGPRSLAFMGLGGQGCHAEAAFGVRLMRGLDSSYHYSALAQEFSGAWWVDGRVLGRQTNQIEPDLEETELLLAVGWNGMVSHQVPQAPKVLQAMGRDPGKLLIVVDPRRTETARIADVHLAIRPGTDALLLRAMIAIVVQEGLEARDYLSAHTSGFDLLRPLFADFDIAAALRVCELDEAKVREVTRAFATRRSSARNDLGLYMNRHSAPASWLLLVLLAACGRIGVRGGNVFHGRLMPLGIHSDERDPSVWRTAATGMHPVAGTFPPSVMPEEILSDHPERLRAVVVSGANPLRSYPDTTAYEKAFGALDLLVTADVAFTETAALSHYVLPARSAYEAWDIAFFPWTFPEVHFQLRAPVLETEGEALEGGEIWLRLADRLGLVPPIPDTLQKAADAGRQPFGIALTEYLKADPSLARALPLIVGKTLGRAMGSVHKSLVWGLLAAAPKEVQANAARVGFAPGPLQGDQVFQALLDHPEGAHIGAEDPAENLRHVRTPDGKIALYIPELVDELRSIEPEAEARALVPDPAYPLVLMAGRHGATNANTLMRDPAWNAGRRACTLAMAPSDAAALGLDDGQEVRITTAAGSEVIELEVTDSARPGHVAIPHGFGLVHEGRVHGVNVNRLTSARNRDAFGTPLHRFVPCRVDPVV